MHAVGIKDYFCFHYERKNSNLSTNSNSIQCSVPSPPQQRLSPLSIKFFKENEKLNVTHGV